MTVYLNARNLMTNYDESDIQAPYNDLVANSSGIVTPGALVVAPNSGMTIQVAAGALLQYISSLSNFYRVYSDAVTNLTIANNSSGSTRIDLICVKFDPTITPDANASNIASILIVQGTAGAGIPATPTNHYVLAEITVASGAASIGAGQITDKRTGVSLSTMLKSAIILTTGGGTTAYTLTPAPAITAYATGQQYTIKINVTNTGPSTINISGLGAKAITKTGAVALAAGELMIDAIYTITYDGTQFQLAGGAGGGGGGTNSFVTTETPSGTINGSNVTFTLANTPVAGTLQIARDGQALYETNDWTLSGATVTMVSAPVTGSVLRASYQITTGTSGNADTLDTFHAAAQPTANMIPVHNASGVLISPIYAPQGFLQNGKLVITVASNNITVALKTLAGTDATAANPIVVRIGDTVRLITAALSVTKNAGTNYHNAGGAELATKEADYFVYLGYNATDGVVIGFSRIPYATCYSDFSATYNDNRFASISTITNAAATDYYENIGRFAATMSAGAGYTWSVPTFTAINLRQVPTRNTRWLAWAPTYTGFSANPSGGVYRYQVTDTTLTAMWYEPNAGTSNSAAKTMTFPFTSSGANANTNVISVLDNSVQLFGKILITAAANTFNLYPGPATTWTTSGSCKTSNGGASVIYELG